MMQESLPMLRNGQNNGQSRDSVREWEQGGHNVQPWQSVSPCDTGPGRPPAQQGPGMPRGQSSSEIVAMRKTQKLLEDDDDLRQYVLKMAR